MNLKNNNDLIFTNKVVSFSTLDDTLVIFNPKLENIEGKIFAVGTIPKGITSNNWTKDKQCAVSWEHVVDFMIFESIEDYKQRVAKSNDESM